MLYHPIALSLFPLLGQYQTAIALRHTREVPPKRFRGCPADSARHAVRQCLPPIAPSSFTGLHRLRKAQVALRIRPPLTQSASHSDASEPHRESCISCASTNGSLASPGGGDGVLSLSLGDPMRGRRLSAEDERESLARLPLKIVMVTTPGPDHAEEVGSPMRAASRRS